MTSMSTEPFGMVIPVALLEVLGAGKSKEDALEQVRLQLPEGHFIASYKVIEGSIQFKEYSAPTVDEAHSLIQLPIGSYIGEERIISPQGLYTLTVQAYTENEAVVQAKTQLPMSARIFSICLVKESQKGFLRKKPATYKVEAGAPAVISVGFKPNVRVVATVSNIRVALASFVKAYGADLQKRTEIVRMLHEIGMLTETRTVRYCNCGYPIGYEVDKYDKTTWPQYVSLFGILLNEVLVEGDSWERELNCPNCGETVGRRYCP